VWLVNDLIQIHRRRLLHRFVRCRSWRCHQILSLCRPKAWLRSLAPYGRQRIASKVYMVLVPADVILNLSLNIPAQLVLPLL
jgi:hypothetical protein